MPEQKRKPLKRKKPIAEQVRDRANSEPSNPECKLPNPKKVISTGSTLLDLAIYGERVKGGGVPGGMILEIYGPSSAGKTAVLVEIAASAQAKGGDVMFDDPEARLDLEYSKLYGLELPKDKYNRSDTVNEMFRNIWGWKPSPRRKNAINVCCEDSLAALSTEMEMTDEDKMGMKRAKDFSAGLRKTCRMIAKNNWLIACTNQERESKGGLVTPGGKGVPYFASLRIRVSPTFKGSKITKDRTINGKKITKTIGVHSTCKIVKSSIDLPYREAPIDILFGHGIDDIRTNLQYMKDTKGLTKYPAVDEEWAMMDRAIKHIEENNLEKDLREQVINMWEFIQKSFEIKRKRKVRF